MSKEDKDKLKFYLMVLVILIPIGLILKGIKSDSKSEKDREIYNQIIKNIEASQRAENVANIVQDFGLESKSRYAKGAGVVGAVALRTYSEYIKNEKFLEYSQFMDTAHRAAGELELKRGYDEILNAINSKYDAPSVLREFTVVADHKSNYFKDGSFFGFDFTKENNERIAFSILENDEDFQRYLGYFMKLRLQDFTNNIDCIEEYQLTDDLSIVCSPHRDELLIIYKNEKYSERVYGWLDVSTSFAHSMINPQ